mmetsp:Transcript_44601/g.52240  ORF Transcript_44601/g.52240 Transcript_44601/m.52240 type:complete len:207 (-) Transcript_44601:1189-1809(-)
MERKSIKSHSVRLRSQASWKEALKKGCIEKARNRRKELLLHARRMTPKTTTGSMEHTPHYPVVHGGTNANANTSDCGLGIRSVALPTVSPADMVRSVVEEELLAANVIVSDHRTSHCANSHSTGADQCISQRMEIVEERISVNHPQEPYASQLVMSEQDMLILMDEIEQELEREKLLLIQEVDIIENEQMEHDQQLEEQVADFEMW